VLRYCPSLTLIAALALGTAIAEPPRLLTLEVHVAEDEVFVVPTAGRTGIVTELTAGQLERFTLDEAKVERKLRHFAGRVIRVRGSVDREARTVSIRTLVSPQRVEVTGTYDPTELTLQTSAGPVSLRGALPPKAAAGSLSIRGWRYEDGIDVDAFQGWLSHDTEAADGPLEAGDAVWLRTSREDFLIAGSKPTRVPASAIRFSPAPVVAAPTPSKGHTGPGLPKEAPVVPLRLLQRRD